MTDNPVPASPPLRKLIESLQERIEKLERHAPRVCFYCGVAGADTKGLFDVPEKPTCAECYPKHVGVKPAPEPSRKQEKPGLSDLLKAAEVGALTIEALDQARADRDWLRAELAQEKKLGNDLRTERDRLAAELADETQRRMALVNERDAARGDAMHVRRAHFDALTRAEKAEAELDKATKNAFEAWAHAGQVQKERDAAIAELAGKKLECLEWVRQVTNKGTALTEAQQKYGIAELEAELDNNSKKAK